jgi:glycosyltransferase involved in cell wall biosynthesis
VSARNPRVVFFLSDLEVGGLQRHAIDLAAHLRRRGYFSNLVVSRDNVSPRLLAGMATDDYVLLNETRKMLDPRSWPRAWKTVAGFRPDVVVGVGQTPLNLMALGKTFGQLDAGLVCTYGTTIPRPRDWRRRPLFRWALRRTDTLAYCSRNQADFCKTLGLGSRRDMVIYNGVDTEAHRPASPAEKIDARSAIGLSASDYVVGLLGAFRPEKNHGQLVRAVQALRARGIPAKALFIGGGATRPAVEADTAALGMSDHVVFAGEHADVRPLIRAMDVGVLCSTAVETFSLSALEMLSTGVPMVHSRLGGAAEMVQDDLNGFLFPIGDTDRLVEILEALADTPRRERISLSARRHVLENFSIEHMVDQYDSLFRSLASGKAA